MGTSQSFGNPTYGSTSYANLTPYGDQTAHQYLANQMGIKDGTLTSLAQMGMNPLDPMWGVLQNQMMSYYNHVLNPQVVQDIYNSFPTTYGQMVTQHGGYQNAIAAPANDIFNGMMSQYAPVFGATRQSLMGKSGESVGGSLVDANGQHYGGNTFDAQALASQGGTIGNFVNSANQVANQDMLGAAASSRNLASNVATMIPQGLLAALQMMTQARLGGLQNLNQTQLSMASQAPQHPQVATLPPGQLMSSGGGGGGGAGGGQQGAGGGGASNGDPTNTMARDQQAFDLWASSGQGKIYNPQTGSYVYPQVASYNGQAIGPQIMQAGSDAGASIGSSMSNPTANAAWGGSNNSGSSWGSGSSSSNSNAGGK